MKCSECKEEIKKSENVRIITKWWTKPKIYCKKCAFNSKLKIGGTSTPIKLKSYLLNLKISLIIATIIIFLILLKFQNKIGIGIAIICIILSIPLIKNYQNSKKLIK
jgi:hypothetical protein